MICIRKPSEQSVREYIWQRQDQPLTYENVRGTLAHATKDQFSADEKYKNFDIDQHHVVVGNGEETFQRAVAALRGWRMFELPWVTLFFPETPVEEGAVVGVLTWQMGMWVLNFCKVVYVISDTSPDGRISRYGFAYGTLEQHLERGEERFMVEYDRATNTVSFDILSFSTPQHWMTQLGYPVARYFQGKFAEEACQALKRAAGASSGTVL
eukprot:TRINITY_DN967_c0_g1_i1.p1 TRINITY_DN967_c0_g1~~TRINITY_DN967_c0_g1_i1.p1  ORF type:complete len:225 (-),score=43.20 TRINITY_DN967_c0_g1_i1:71-703(-)